MPIYHVVVGVTGVVYDGPDVLVAKRSYRMFVAESRKPFSKTSGQPVSLIKDGSVIKEHRPDVRRGIED